MNEAVSDPTIVTLLGDRYRIIESRCGLQWTIEKRAGQRHGSERWDAVKYCRTREGLIASCRGFGFEFTADEQATLDALPDFFGEDAKC